MRPRLSIITITYRQPEALARTLASMAQMVSVRTPSWEHLVVDSSPEMNADTIRAAQNLVHLPRPANGIYPAMNAGLTAAKGELVWFLNGGDELAAPDALLAVIRAMDSDPGAEMALAAAQLHRNGVAYRVQHPRAGIWPMIGINRVCHQAMLYRKDVFERLGFFNESYRLAADYEFHLRALHDGVRTITVPDVLVRYDMGGQSANAGKVFAEFRQVHKDLSLTGRLPGSGLHSPVRWLERVKIALIQSVRS